MAWKGDADTKNPLSRFLAKGFLLQKGMPTQLKHKLPEAKVGQHKATFSHARIPGQDPVSRSSTKPAATLRSPRLLAWDSG